MTAASTAGAPVAAEPPGHVPRQLLTEARRSRLLRRVDWRFLLDEPQPARAVCFATGELAEAVALICGDIVPVASARDAECDVAVAVEPDDGVIAAARDALRVGGAFYGEWHGALRRPALPQLRAQLERAGFTDIAFLLPQAGPQRDRVAQWVPLTAPAVLAYSARVRDPAQTWRGRIARALAERWHARTRFRFAAPVCALAWKGAPSGEHPLRSPAARLSEFGAPLLLTWGASSVNKVIALTFPDGAPEPRLVVKMPRVPESVAGLGREAAMLRTLERRGVRGVPRVVFDHTAGHAPRLGLRALPGRRLHEVLTARNAHALALRAARWQVHLAGQTMTPPPHDWWRRMIEPVLTEFQACYGAALDAGLLRASEEALASLGPLPVVCEQRDFAPWNLLVDERGELSVLDWEWSRTEGVPGIDLIHCLAYFGIYLQDAHATGRYRDAYRPVLGDGSRFGDTAQECLTLYAQQVGIRREDVRPLRVLTWILHALPEYQLLASAAGGHPAPEQLRSTVFLKLWDAELRIGG